MWEDDDCIVLCDASLWARAKRIRVLETIVGFQVCPHVLGSSVCIQRATRSMIVRNRHRACSWQRMAAGVLKNASALRIQRAFRLYVLMREREAIATLLMISLDDQTRALTKRQQRRRRRRQ